MTWASECAAVDAASQRDNLFYYLPGEVTRLITHAVNIDQLVENGQNESDYITVMPQEGQACLKLLDEAGKKLQKRREDLFTPDFWSSVREQMLTAAENMPEELALKYWGLISDTDNIQQKAPALLTMAESFVYSLFSAVTRPPM